VTLLIDYNFSFLAIFIYLNWVQNVVRHHKIWHYRIVEFNIRLKNFQAQWECHRKLKTIIPCFSWCFNTVFTYKLLSKSILKSWVAHFSGKSKYTCETILIETDIIWSFFLNKYCNGRGKEIIDCHFKAWYTSLPMKQ